MTARTTKGNAMAERMTRAEIDELRWRTYPDVEWQIAAKEAITQLLADLDQHHPADDDRIWPHGARKWLTKARAR